MNGKIVWLEDIGSTMNKYSKLCIYKKRLNLSIGISCLEEIPIFLS
ncbi:hypothetical protein BJV85_003708 [Clostridium acetobutylicum]|nr:hypothetical protein [Clostridium acetobutylicum]NOW16360.1 hypothetical protein [Clostridium acetobutylicum]NSA94785.1 hypothetical protein [Clostridium acetobutylicum]NYC95956.1 hypothetical protein [Clostridium acetobutylicum]